MTSHDQEEWWSIVQDLREDQEAIAETWKESRKQYHDLNTSCDQLIQSLWVVHSLNFSLQKVFSHRLAPCEWIMSRDEASAIQFVNSTQVLSTNLQDSYSRFLDDLRTHPEVMAEVIQWVGNEGLDSTHFAHDVISVIYGHCLFKEDHEFLLTTLLHLFQDHVNHCSNYKDLFSIEPVCSRFITEYCHQLPSLKVFLTQVLRQPLQRIVVQSSRYLEYEVSKISTRFPEDTSVDLNEYATISSQQIAQFCMEILYQLNKHQNHFPPSLKWLLGSLKNLILQKWPSISPSFLRRPISYVLFGFIISSAFINSDLMGVLDIHIAMNDVALHNISQVIGVLQGCAWIVDKLDRTDYPMRHVVSQMDMVFFNALIDSIDSGLNDNINPPVSSLLPGLCRSVFLWSKDQLDDIVGTINDANCSFMELPEPSPRHVQLNEIVSVIPNMVVQKVRRNPYSFSVKNIMKAGSHPYLNRDDLQVPPTVKSPKHKRNKQRSRSVWGAEKPSLVDIGKSNTIQYTRNISKSESNPNVPSICLSPSGIDDVFEEQTPQEVIVLPIGRGTTSAPLTPSKTSWDIELMSEEEYIQKCKPRSCMKTLSVMETNARIELSDNPMILVNGYQENNTNDEIVDVVPSLLQEEVSEEKGSIKSWSPETYNGSISAEEEIVELPMAKSCEIIDDRPEPSPARMTTSTSAPIKSKKGLKGWLKKISKSRKKVSKASDNLELIEAGRERKESYTKKVENITAKYEQIVREKKASEPPPLPPPLPAVEETNFINEYYFKRPMTIKEFVSSNMFDQLKYKLTTVLRNIHFPMLPLHFSVEDNEDNLKTRLTALLELVQHHTKWNDDYSECCVISEILNQLQYLDVECVQVLLDGVKDNHQTHLQYLNYLSNFQKKCHNARLEIVSLQSTIGRLRCLQEESFLNFTISLFFEQRAARLHQVMKDLENCGTADEKYALVQDCRISMTKALEKDLIWQLWAEDLEQVHRICDDRIFAYLYDHLFHPNGDSDKERDGVFHGHIQRIAKSITPGHRLLKISPIYYSSHPWLPVQNLLNDMAIYKSPFSKLNCIIKACKLLIRLLQLARCGNPPGADDIFPVLVYVLIQANPASLLSTEQYVKTFCEDTLTGETDYWWTQFRSAVGFLRTPEFTQHINF